MQITGIVAEYNPFHMGHAYQIQKIREILGQETGIVCVMSGDFVQRGEPAIFNKYARAEAALAGGADLVLELPLPWCIGSAEFFAGGAIEILNRLQVVDYLCFGSESGNLADMQEIARAEDSPEYSTFLSEKLQQGVSFPTARQQALQEIAGAAANCLATPNDLLGIEYLKALNRKNSSICPMPIQRVGAAHDRETDQLMKSGSELRKILTESEGTYNHIDLCAHLFPKPVWDVWNREVQAGRGPITMARMEPMIMSRLRFLKEADFVDLPDASEGLEHKLYAACRTESGIDAICTAVKSKRYTYARVRRMVLFAALGIQKSDFKKAPNYARVLAANSKGTEILRAAKMQGNIDIISKPAAIRKLGPEAQHIFDCTSRGHDFYVLSYKNAGDYAGSADWKTSPYIRWEK